jgi:hypothetical protein
MAEYGIVIGIKDIKGNCALEGFKDHLLSSSVSFGSTTGPGQGAAPPPPMAPMATSSATAASSAARPMSPPPPGLPPSGSNSKTAAKVRRLSVAQSAVTVTMPLGKWIAELQEACYLRKNLGEITLVQLGQAIDKNATAKPTVMQTLKLTNAVVTAIQQSWTAGDGPRVVGVSFLFEKFLLELGDKGPVADFTLRNFSAGAV